jgi:hypothetical protein
MAKQGRRQWNDLWAEVITAGVAVNPASMTTGTDSSTTATVAGAAVGDAVIAIPGVDMGEVSFNAYVSAANTVEIVFYNSAAGTVDLASSTWKFIVLRPEAGHFV